MANEGLTPIQELAAGIGALVTLLATAAGSFSVRKKHNREAISKSIDPLVERVTVLEVRQERTDAGIQELKSDVRETRNQVGDVAVTVGEIHGMLSNRRKDDNG